MKKFILYSAVLFAITSIYSCSKDDELELQRHDENRMMDSLHAMMNRMESMTPTNDPEIDFPKMMIMHHQGAINMGNVQIAEGKNDSLKRFSQKMVSMQEMEIDELQDILETETENNSVPEFTQEQMDHMMKMDQIADVQLITGDLDNDFATLMILHHNSAIENSESYLKHGTNESLKEMAHEMIDAQKKEIKELSDWLKANKR